MIPGIIFLGSVVALLTGCIWPTLIPFGLIGLFSSMALVGKPGEGCD